LWTPSTGAAQAKAAAKARAVTVPSTGHAH
jgi:hypothetical protein